MAQPAHALDVSRQETILTKAALRAAELLDVNNREFAAIVGVSPSFVTKLRAGTSVLAGHSKSMELDVQFVRAFRSLDAVVGGDAKTAKAWLRNHNTALDAVPVEYMKSVVGLIDIVNYLDQRRAPL